MNHVRVIQQTNQSSILDNEQWANENVVIFEPCENFCNDRNVF